MPVNGTVDDPLLRPIISNIRTASYHVAKYLGKMLSPLSQSEYTGNNNIQFINYVEAISIPSNHKLILFDVKSLYINVALDFTIDLIQKLIYEDSEIQMNIKKKGNKGTTSFMYKKCLFYLESYKKCIFYLESYNIPTM